MNPVRQLTKSVVALGQVICKVVLVDFFTRSWSDYQPLSLKILALVPL